eukprot:gnl/TRDRNA2_/TRDRNA2_125823_c0_seq2.p1 gnl/TRDRNA2_/TRDRNA2_125823_c0~~gnl/TRDRNA2_/TRDRNA2_125823_c0_seq2.p1  ORF type:complete len:277 (+),score=25.78 gnl/TRDRNA2_/TRDRNA2_125823_c0_seq2:55-885(+)
MTAVDPTAHWVHVPPVIVDLLDDCIPSRAVVGVKEQIVPGGASFPFPGRSLQSGRGGVVIDLTEESICCSSSTRLQVVSDICMSAAAGKVFPLRRSIGKGRGSKPGGPIHPNVRLGLAQVQMQRLRFRGTVRRLGKTRGVRRAWRKQTVLLVDVHACEHADVAADLPVSTDHVWLKVGKQLADIGMHRGDLVEFDARVRWYKKCGGWDLQLSHHTKVSLPRGSQAAPRRPGAGGSLDTPGPRASKRPGIARSTSKKKESNRKACHATACNRTAERR